MSERSQLSDALLRGATTVLLIGLAAIPGQAQTGLSISNVHGSATSAGVATITWQTTAAATSQVIFVDNSYETICATPKDPAVDTTHTVIVSVRPGMTYTYYVASGNQSGLVSSADPSRPTTFTTPSRDLSGPQNYRVDLRGPSDVVQGHDLYVAVSTVLLSGVDAHLFFDPPSGLPAGGSVHVLCNYNPAMSNEYADSFWDTAGRQWCYFGNDADFTIRVRTSPTTPPGAYVVTLPVVDGGNLARSITIPFNVLPVPPIATRQVSATTSIPGFDIWQQKMASLGQSWCNPLETMAFGYYAQVWFYDGARAYLQLSDYTNKPSQWAPCATNIIEQYRDYVLRMNGAVQGYSVFPHGLAMNYWRTGDSKSMDAVIALATGSPYASSAGGVDVGLIRETSYLIETWTIAERLGQAHDARLDRAIDFALGYIDQFVTLNGTLLNQPFYDGLLAEALIQYYELTNDVRVPGAIKQLLDCVWANGWNANTQQMVYSTIDVPSDDATALTPLIAPAFAWYWAVTGDSVYRDRGDQLFSAGIGQDISYSGKVFTQSYRWTFDYVQWRQQGIPVPSAFLAGFTDPQSPLAVAIPIALTFDTALSGGVATTGTVWLSKPVQQATAVQLSQPTSQTLQIPTSVQLIAGTQHAQFSIIPATVSQPQPATVQVSVNSNSIQASTIVTPGAWGNVDVSSLWAPVSMNGGGSTITVYLTGQAPVGGITVQLASSNAAVIPVPASVVVPAGATFVYVPVTVTGLSTPTNVVIQGSVRSTVSVTIQVAAAAAVDVASLWAPGTVMPGGADFVVYLTGPAPAGGITVQLASSNAAVIPVPASVVVPAGATFVDVPVTVTGLSVPTNVLIQGSVRSTVTATIQVATTHLKAVLCKTPIRSIDSSLGYESVSSWPGLPAPEAHAPRANPALLI